MPSLNEMSNKIIRHITLEPAVLLYMLGSMFFNIGSTNLLLEKSCRVNLRFSASVCDAMTLRNNVGYEFNQEAEVQQLVSRWLGYKMILMGSIPVIWMIFLGSWSDRQSRRKPLMLGAVFGQIVGAIGSLICSYFFLELSLEYVWMFYVSPYFLFGADGCFFLAVYSYVGGLCTEEDKTLKIGTVASCFPIAVSLGNFLGGIILNHFGYKVIFTVSATSSLLAFLLILFMVKERGKTDMERKKRFKNCFGDLFQLEHIIDTFRTCFSKGKGKKRQKMIVVIVLCVTIASSLYGESNILYLYTRLKCGWNEVDFGIFNSVHFCIQMIGNFFSLSFFSKYLKLDDSILGAIAMISKILGCLIYAFAPSGMYFYVGALIEIFYATSSISLRAIMAKIKPPHELGKSNSVFGICEAMGSLALGQLYAELYIRTMTVFPGLFFLVTVAFYTVGLCLFIWLYQHRERNSEIHVEMQKPADVEEKIMSE